MNNEKKLKPLAGNILLEEIKQDDTSESGIIIPDEAKERVSFSVVAVGDDVLNVSVGDEVMVSEFTEQEVKVGGKKYYLCDESMVIGKLE